jgi:signal transduction histidine kinase
MQAAATRRLTASARDDADSRRRRRQVEPVIWASAMAVLTAALIAGEASSGGTPYLALDIVVGVVSVSLVSQLRRWMVPAVVLLSLLCAVSPAATPSATMGVLVVAERQRRPVALAVVATGIAAHLIRGGWRPVSGLPYVWWAVLVCVAYAALAGWGMLMRANRALITSLRQRAEQAEAEQGRRVAEARSAERSRIAREMHDVLAHRLSLLATYAGALAYRPDAPPEQLSRAAEVVRTGAHQALDELREVIGLLRDDDLPDLTTGSRPLPGIAELPRLIEESREAGMVIEGWGAAGGGAGDGCPGAADVGGAPGGGGGLGVDGVPGAGGGPGADAVPDVDGVPDVVGRTVYRVVQEGLTNVRKHAPGSTARVAVSGRPGAGLDVCVASRLVPARAGAAEAVPGTGTGLIGLTERVELAGGRLDYGASDGEFVLRAWLPWTESA